MEWKMYNVKVFECLKQIAPVIPVPIYWLDLDQKYLGLNEAALKAIGALSYEKDFRNKTPYDIYPEEMAIEIIEHHREVIRSNKVLSVSESIKNLSTKKIQYFNAVISPLLDDSNQVIGTIGISIDITEEKKKAALLKKETIFEQLNMIAPLIPANVYWLDVNNIIRGVNEKTLQAIGLASYEDIVGKTVYDLYPQDMADIIIQHHNETIKTRKTLKHEEVIKDVKTGETKYFTTVKSPIIDGDEVIGSIGISIDITERKNMEEELNFARIAAESANVLKTNFVQNMQHDIRTPATSVWAVLDNLVSNHQLPDEELLIMLKNSAKQLMDICNDVIDFDRIEHGEIPILSKRFNIWQVLNNIIDLNKIAAFNKGLSLSFSMDEKIPQVIKGDEHRLSRILINLMGNALKFTSKGSIQLTVNLIKELEKKYIIQFKLQDTGIGIHPEKQNTIYEKFNRLSPANRNHYKGSGLGLRIVKKYVDDLGGEINVQSELNKGTIFFIDIPFEKALLETVYDNQLSSSPIPVIEKKPIETNKPLNVAITTSNKSKGRIYNTLLIEDNILARKVGETILKSLNCHVTTAIDVASALELLHRMKFDLVVADIGLPDGTGIDVIKAVKGDSNALNFTTPFCALTANADPDTIKESEHAGFFKVMAKPMLAGKIEAILNEYVSEANEPERDTLSKSLKLSQKLKIPEMKAELFDLKRFSLFDLASGLNAVGCKKEDLENHLKKLVSLAHDEEAAIKKAVAMRNWSKVGNLALKIKERAVYCGVIKLRNACYYLEYYCKEEASSSLLDALSEQLIKVMQETKQCLIKWLQQKNKFSTPSSNASFVGGLGIDLPDTEEQLFKLEQYPLLDDKIGIESFGSEEDFSETLQLMIDDISTTKIEIQQAYVKEDWDKVEKLAHKAKGGALCIGTLRMKYACQYLERYRKAGHSASLEKLYQQLLEVLTETQNYIEAWLKSKN